MQKGIIRVHSCSWGFGLVFGSEAVLGGNTLL